MTEFNPTGQSEKPVDPREEQMLEALLERSLGDFREQDDLRVDRLIDPIRQSGNPASGKNEVEIGNRDPSKRMSTRNRRKAARASRSYNRWMTISGGFMAVVVAILFSSSGRWSQNEALAALDSSLRAEDIREDRHYQVNTVFRSSNARQSRSRDHELYLRGNDYVVSTRAFPKGRLVWSGSHEGQHWVVPRVGPVLVGGDQSFFEKRGFQANLTETPFLSISKVLERTKRFYDLTFEPTEERVVGDQSYRCSVVTGKRKRDVELAIPEFVEVWVDAESGFARKIQLKWDPDGHSRWLEASAEWIDSPRLPDDFFQHQAHHDPQRSVIVDGKE